MQLKLYAPRPQQALQHSPEIRHNVTAQWLEQFDGSDPEAAAQKLLTALGGINRAEVDNDTRFKLALLYEPVIQKLIEALIATLPENGTPQVATHRQAASLTYELALELAYAWKLVFLGLEQQRRPLFGGGKTRQNTLDHLADALARQICTSYRTYTPPPQGSWHELHQVFRAARQEKTRQPRAGDTTPPPAEAAYKRALLLALADPFRLTRTEADATLAFLEKFGHFARLSADSSGWNSSVFLLDLDSDGPGSQDISRETPDLLALDTQALCKHLRSLRSKLKNGSTLGDIGLTDAHSGIDGLSLLSGLHHAWRGTSKRGFNRYEPELLHAEVVSGFSAIHRLLDTRNGKVNSSPAQSHVAGPPAEDAPARWRILNDSASGLSISAHAQEVAQLRLGNLVALRLENTTDAGWMLGIIRWGKMSRGQVVTAGIEKLSPHASSAVFRILRGNSNIGESALLIPANAALQSDERLLLPHGQYARGRIADMWHNGQCRRIAFGSMVEQSPFFDLIELDPA